MELNRRLIPKEGIEVEDSLQDVAIFPSTYIFVVLNAAVPPFDDIHFRRAAAAYSLLTPFHGFADTDARLITEELTTLEPTCRIHRVTTRSLADAELLTSQLRESHEDVREVAAIQSHGFTHVFVERSEFRSSGRMRLTFRLKRMSFRCSRPRRFRRSAQQQIPHPNLQCFSRFPRSNHHPPFLDRTVRQD